MTNQLRTIIILSIIGANLTWIIVLAFKREILQVGKTKVAEAKS